MDTAPHRWMDGFTPHYDSMDRMRDQAEEIRQKFHVNPLQTAPTPREETLLDHYATKGEIATVRAAHARIAETEKELARVLVTMNTVLDQITTARLAGKQDTERAAALALGEPVPDVPDVPSTGPSLAFLQTQKVGLEQRANRAHDAVAEAKGKFRGAVYDLMHECARRCAEDYESLTRQQAWCHQQLAIAQSLVGSRQHIVDITTWNKYFVPGSPHLDVLKHNCREEWGQFVRMSADRLMTTERDARMNLTALGKELFGEWPL